jgi:hypothetical protein
MTGTGGAMQHSITVSGGSDKATSLPGDHIIHKGLLRFPGFQQVDIQSRHRREVDEQLKILCFHRGKQLIIGKIIYKS